MAVLNINQGIPSNPVYVTDTAAETALTALAALIASGKLSVSDAAAETSLAALAALIASGKLSVSDAAAETSLAALAALIASGKLSVSDAAAETSLAALAALIASGALKVSDAALEAVISGGALKVSVQNPSIAITAATLPLPNGAATEAKQPAAADESSFTAGTTLCVPIAGRYSDRGASSLTGTPDAMVTPQISSTRGLYVNLRADDGTELGYVSGGGSPLAVTFSGAPGVQPELTYSKGVNAAQFIGNIPSVVTLTGTTTTTVVAVATGFLYYYVTGIICVVTPNTTISGGGPCTVTFKDAVSGTVVFSFAFWAPATFTAATQALVLPAISTPHGFFFDNKSIGTLSTQQLTASLSVALTTGSVIATVNYGLAANSVA